MNKLNLAVLVAVVGVALTAMSPVMANPHHKPGRVKKLATALHLSKAQENRLRPEIMANAREAAAIHHDHSLTRGQQKRDLRNLHRQNAAAIRSQLSPDQQARLRALQEQRRAKRHDHH